MISLCWQFPWHNTASRADDDLARFSLVYENASLRRLDTREEIFNVIAIQLEHVHVTDIPYIYHNNINIAHSCTVYVGLAPIRRAIHMTDVPTDIYISIAHSFHVYVGLAQARPNIYILDVLWLE